MTTLERVRLVGAGVDRVDGPRKVTGSAPYPNDVSFPNLAHAALVRSTIAAGRIRRIATGPAEAAPGVLAVISHENAPKLERGPATRIGPQPPPPLQDDRILHHGQYVAVVVASTAEQATAAARLVEVDYDPVEPLLDLDDPRAEVLADPWGLDEQRGDVAAGLEAAEVTVEATYTTPDETNNPLGLFATVAFWDGDRLTVHDATQWLAMDDDNAEPVTMGTPGAYACPNVATRDQQKRLNIPCPGPMRAPGDAEGNFALESTLDELSYAVAMDPLQLRLRNYAEVHPRLGLPWSSKALRACYQQGAERFGWSRRTPQVGSMRDGRWLVGYGMASVAYAWYQVPCQARASIGRDGKAFVRSAATDIGTGTYTVMTQLSAELLGLGLDQVRFDLGDSDMPMAPQAGGSGLTASLGNAIHATCGKLIQAFLDTVADDAESPLRGCRLGDVTVDGGRIRRADDPDQNEAYTDILARHGLDELTADGDSAPLKPQDVGLAPSGPFAAKFVEVRVDPDLGLVRVARVVSAIDAGQILNQKTARSQIIGGTVGGIGMALLEETVSDPGTGRIANATLGDYLVAVNADVPDMEVLFVGEPDRFNPIGVKGVGEIGLVGVGAAVANAVYHATGRRIRSLPITIDKLL